jgi:hypothetical protein
MMGSLIQFIAERLPGRTPDLGDLAQSYFSTHPHKVSPRLQTNAANVFEAAGRLSYLDINAAQELISTGKARLCDDGIVFVSNRHVSKSGREISLVACANPRRHQINRRTLIAYAEVRDMAQCAEAASRTTKGGGPGHHFPGSVGVIEFEITPKGQSMLVNHIQSSFHPKKAFDRGLLPKELLRAYSAWPIVSLCKLFSSAKDLGVAEVVMPGSAVLAGIETERIEQIAQKSGFERGTGPYNGSIYTAKPST